MNRTEPDPPFHRWVEKKRKGWVRLAQRALGNRDEAEDVVQDTLVAVWRRLPGLGLRDRDAYAARSIWLNALKRAKRGKRHLPFPEGFEPAAPEPLEEEPDEWDPLALEEAVAQLPEPQKAVVRLKYYGGLTFREIGETLAISINTAGSRCRYALGALRDVLGRKGGSDGTET